jgi:hypothetical protein
MFEVTDAAYAIPVEGNRAAREIERAPPLVRHHLDAIRILCGCFINGHSQGGHLGVTGQDRLQEEIDMIGP